MSIDKINGINKIYPQSEVKPLKPKEKTNTASDNISISEEAKEMALRDKYFKIVKEAPEIDNKEKIEELKSKINKPDYITQKLIDDIAKKIAESLGLL
ncbi:MAG: flagellar biosynthesis anti-sigma factor FlgM [Spirochaetes bacterium]|nr:flagellar biosynthesis anti-sigma factor FlgM [Spirochaetota bacterium]